MTLLYLFAKQYQGSIMNTDDMIKPLLFDQVMSDYKNHEIEFVTMKNGHTKAPFKDHSGRMCYKSKNGELYPVMNEGERVSKSQSVAVVKNDNSDYIEGKIKELKDKLSVLSTPTVFSNDIKLLDSEVDMYLNNFIAS